MWSEETVNAMLLALTMIGGHAAFRETRDDTDTQAAGDGHDTTAAACEEVG